MTWGTKLIIVLMFSPVSPAYARIVQQTVPVQMIAEGGVCDRVPDRFVKAPDVPGGKVEEKNARFDFVIQGDRFPSQLGLGIGVRAVISGYGRGSLLTVVILDPIDRISKWDMRVNGAGYLEFGQLAPRNGSLIQGRYRLTVRDGERILFVNVIDLYGYIGEDPCKAAPAVS